MVSRATLDGFLAELLKEAAPITPQGMLSAARRVGTPSRMAISRSPSVAQLAKPVGFGKPIPGATKTGI